MSTATTDATSLGFKPRLIEFHGHEGEDFRFFKHILETFFSIMNINSNQRRLTILMAQLRRSAATFVSRYLKKLDLPRDETLKDHITYDRLMEVLQERYITPELVQRFELAFNDMVQGENESPQHFLSRLYEAAVLAEIDDDNLIQSRFRAGLLREIRVFCIQCSSKTFEDWTMHADGWWNAHHQVDVALVENPFVASTHDYQPNYESGFYRPLNLDKTMNFPLIKIPGPKKEQSLRSNAMSTRPYDKNSINESVEQLTARLRSLELNQIGNETAQMLNDKPFTSKSHNRKEISETDIVNLIRKTIKDELRMNSRPNNSNGQQYYRNNDYPPRNYRNRPRNNSFNDASRDPNYFDNEYAEPTSGYYPNQRQPFDNSGPRRQSPVEGPSNRNGSHGNHSTRPNQSKN
jgi:hypothetical protein